LLKQNKKNQASSYGRVPLATFASQKLLAMLVGEYASFFFMV